MPRSAGRLAVATLLLLLVVFTRFYRLDTLPPGHVFDSHELGDALRIAQGYGLRALIYDTDPEPAWRFVIAGWYWLVGPSIFTTRVIAAFVTILGAALTYRAARLLLRGQPYAHTGALIAMAVLSSVVAYYFVFRNPYRALLLPALVPLVIVLLLTATTPRRQFISGLVAGLGMHTYLAGLAVPVWVVGWLAHQKLFNRLPWRRLGLTLAGMVLPFIAWVLVVTLISNLGYRLSQLPNPYAHLSLVERILYSYRDALLAVFWRGYPFALYNVESLPWLNPALALLCLIGALGALWRWRQSGPVLLITGWLSLSLPAVLSAVPFHTLRSSGVYPILGLLAGAGAAWLLGRFPRRFAPAAVAAAILLGAGSMLWTLNAYASFYHDAETQPIVRDPNPIAFVNVPGRDAVDWLLATDQPTYVPVWWLDIDFSTFGLLGGRYHRVTSWARYGLTELPAGQVFYPRSDALGAPVDDATPYAALLLPAEGTIVMLPATPDGAPLISRPDTPLVGQFGVVYADVGAVPAQPLPDLPPFDAEPVRFGPLALLNASYSATLTPGESRYVVYYWRVEEPIPNDVFTVLQLIDPNYNAVVRSEDRPPTFQIFPAVRWQVGDIISDVFLLPIPETLDAPRYRWGTLAYTSPPGVQMLPLQMPAEQRNELPTLFLWGSLRTDTPETPAPLLPQDAVALDLIFGDGVRLDGYTLRQDAGIWTLELYWRGLRQQPAARGIFVHLMQGDILVGQDDRQPDLPVWAWHPDERVITTHTLTLAPDAQPDGIFIGMYYYPTLTRLSAWLDGQRAPDDRPRIWSAGE